MKRITVFFLLFSGFIYSIFPQFSNDNDFTDPYYTKGVYLPLEHITSLEETKNNFIAMSLNKDHKYHTILAVTTDSIIYYNYEDSWNIIPVWEITDINTKKFPIMPNYIRKEKGPIMWSKKL